MSTTFTLVRSKAGYAFYERDILKGGWSAEEDYDYILDQCKARAGKCDFVEVANDTLELPKKVAPKPKPAPAVANAPEPKAKAKAKAKAAPKAPAKAKSKRK